MNKLHFLQYRQERVAARIDKLNVLASSASPEQHLIKFDLVAALEGLRTELVELRKEVDELVEAEQVIS